MTLLYEYPCRERWAQAVPSISHFFFLLAFEGEEHLGVLTVGFVDCWTWKVLGSWRMKAVERGNRKWVEEF